MARVWNAPLDPRDYRMLEQEEKYEGPAFKEMMEKETPETIGSATHRRPARQHDPHRKPVRHWYERS